MEKLQIIQYNNIMYNKRSKLFWKIFFAQVGVGLAILVCAFSIIYYAQGYRFNYRNLKIVKTGIINVEPSPKVADVYIDNKFRSAQTPYFLNLLEGYHNVEIKKDGYQDWEMTYYVEPGLVVNSKDIVLFKKDITPVVLTDAKKIAQLHEPVDFLARKLSNNLSYNNHEIWLGDVLLVRFFKQIDHVAWYPDFAHIVYQQGDEIRVVDEYGKNDTLLVKMNNKNITNVVFGEKNTEMYYTDGTVDTVAGIR